MRKHQVKEEKKEIKPVSGSKITRARLNKLSRPRNNNEEEKTAVPTHAPGRRKRQDTSPLTTPEPVLKHKRQQRAGSPTRQRHVGTTTPLKVSAQSPVWR